LSLKKNVLANYVSQFYVTGVGILILPLYIKHMGAEAYGLVGFFAMLQAWFTLLDFGLTPTIGRETARYLAGSITPLFYRQLLRALSIIFLFIAFVGGGLLWSTTGVIASSWLTVENIAFNEVVFALEVIALSVSLRWLCGLYRGIITGSEQLVWLSFFNILISSLRFIGVFISMHFYGFTPKVFFIHQLLVALIEFCGLWLKGISLIPSKSDLNQSIGWSLSPVKSVLKFALTIAFTSSVWVLVTQVDKLILSGILSLNDYGYFTLSVLVASGILVISGPVSGAIMPRMSRLFAENKFDDLLIVYRNSTQLVSVIAGTAAIIIAFWAEPILLVWSGDATVAANSSYILKLYALGNAVLAIAAFPYYLQYAMGNLRYHLIGNFIILIALIPAIIFAASNFGGVGAGYAWLSVNSIYLIFWVSYVHHKLKPGLHLKWLINDCLLIYLPIILVLSICESFKFENLVGWKSFIYYCSVFTLVVFTAAFTSSFLRRRILLFIKGN